MSLTDITVPTAEELEALVGEPEEWRCARPECERTAEFTVIYRNGTHLHACTEHTSHLLVFTPVLHTVPMPCPLPHLGLKVIRSTAELNSE